MAEQVFVIADNYPQAVQWAHDHGVSTRDLVYLASPEDAIYRTAGRRGGTYMCVGTWEDKPSWQLHSMFGILTARGFTRRSEDELPPEVTS